MRKGLKALKNPKRPGGLGGAPKGPPKTRNLQGGGGGAYKKNL